MQVEKIYLTGYTAVPPRREISKTAIGAEEWIPWEYQKDPMAVITQLKAVGYGIVGLELADNAVPIMDYSAEGNICLVVGHEVTGVPTEILEACNSTVYIPMHGKKESLNVSVALGIALHSLRNS